MKRLNRYSYIAIIVSVVVAILIHFPEIIALFLSSEIQTFFPDITVGDVVSEVVYTFLSLSLIFALNIIIFKFNLLMASVTWRRIMLSFIFSFFLSSILSKCFILLHEHLDIPAIDSARHYILHPLRDFIIACVATGTCYMLYLLRRQQAITMEVQQLRLENIRNQYEALKHQLNPHMFFNSLNTLQALVREDSQRAQSYIQELSKVLRYTLEVGDLHNTNLRSEMEFTQAYIYLLKVRYEENLAFDIDIDDKFLECRLPNISVQVLVENAVKHNEISSRRNFTISIRTDDNGNLCVSNPIQLKRFPVISGGIGLSNLSKRYELLFHRDITIMRKDNIFTVKLPLVKL